MGASQLEQAVRDPATASDLKITDPATPRPGDIVLWYQSHSPLSGVLQGHRANGSPYVLNSFGQPSFPRSFETIRLVDPVDRVGPNWDRLPTDAKIVRPLVGERARLAELLQQRTPPGPRYSQLIEEIHARGYEVFVVGGTVRDVIAGVQSNDVDLATTMPLDRVLPLVQSMYRNPKGIDHGARINGHLRLGGAYGTSDPFIDLSLFKDTFVGSREALFSDSFSADVANRDFACNAVYYEPIGNVFIDPTGVGVTDAEARLLRVICDQQRRNAAQVAQVAVRYFKFRSRGFVAVDGCPIRIAEDFLPMLAAVGEPQRVQYMRRQLLGKVRRGEERETLAVVREEFVNIGALKVWETLVAPFEEELLA